MRVVALSATVVSLLCLAGLGHAQQDTRLFFEGDMVRGDQEGAPGPFCVLTNQFKRLEKVVWRVRVLDQTGKALDDKGIKELRFVRILLPPQGCPTGYPSGTFVYRVVATDLNGNTQTWEPFKRVTSQLQVVAGEIEIKKSAAPK